MTRRVAAGAIALALVGLMVPGAARAASPVLRGSPTSALEGVSDVVSLRAPAEMGRVAARGVVAGVEGQTGSSSLSSRYLQGEAVGQSVVPRRSTPTDDSVSLPGAPFGPGPAGFGPGALVDSSAESSEQGGSELVFGELPAVRLPDLQRISRSAPSLVMHVAETLPIERSRAVFDGAVGSSHVSNHTLRICSANLMNTPDMPDWKVRADAAEARDRCDLVLWQEIREKADHRAIQGKGWRSTPYGAGGVPISWRTSKITKDSAARITRVSTATPRCANGRPSYNPARYIGSVRLKVRATGQRVTAVSLHFPQRRTCRDAAQKWRDAFNNTRAHLPRGAVVVGGDWNRRENEIPNMIGGQHWISPAPRGLDHVFVARTGWQVTGRFTRDLHSDHHLIGTRLRG